MQSRHVRAGLQTLLVHPEYGEALPKPGAIAPILDRSSTFRLDDAAENALASGQGADRLDVYGRYGTQTTRQVAGLLAKLEGTEAAVLFSSGTAAVATTIAELVPPGGLLAAAFGLYGGTEVSIGDELRERGVRCVRFDAGDPASLVGLLQADVRPDLVWCESISNPLLEVASLADIGRACRSAGVPLGVDNTFTGGIAAHPAGQGATVVVHSATKYIGGHSDVVAGVACGDAAIVQRLWARMIRTGSCIDPMAAWLLARGIRTLPLRWHRQCETAGRLATALAEHPAISRVFHPSMDGSGGVIARPERIDGCAMVAFELRGGGAAAARFLTGVRLCTHATSLGGIETLVCSPARSSHAKMAPDQRAALGITEGVVRMSVGIEDFEDLWLDVRRALEDRG